MSKDQNDGGAMRQMTDAEMAEQETHAARRLTDEVAAFMRYPTPGNGARVAGALERYQCAWMNGRKRPGE